MPTFPQLQTLFLPLPCEVSPRIRTLRSPPPKGGHSVVLLVRFRPNPQKLGGDLPCELPADALVQSSGELELFCDIKS